jgi:hypothetical protein
MAPQMVQATQEMANQLVSFHNAHYNDNREPGHWIWEYKGCYPDLSVFPVMVEEGRVVGTTGFIPIYVNVAGERVLSGKPENSLVSRDQRGSDIYSDIYAYAKSDAVVKGYQCLWGYGPLRSASTKVGYTVFLNAIASLGTVIRPFAALKDAQDKKEQGLKKYAREIVGRLLLWIYGSVRRATTGSSNDKYVLRAELANQADMDDLYRRLRERYPNLIHIDLNERYLEWRIHDNPFCDYKSYFVYRGGQLAAYSFVSRHNTKAYLTDFTFDDDSSGNFLLSAIVKDLKALNTGVIAFLGNRENPLIKNTFKVLRKWGFVEFSATNFHVQPFQGKREELLLNLENWYMNGIGTEGNQI